MAILPSIFGPTGVLSGFFLTPDKLLIGLAFLIPLVLLYLIKPKPQNVAVPSLMFILKDMGKSNVHRFFRTLLKDFLFLIQFLIILLLALSLGKPFIEVNQESLVESAILIVDTSASTRAFDDDRFEEIRDLALDSLSKDNIVILSQANPQVLAIGDEQRLSAGEARDAIRDLEPSDLAGDLPTALDLATQYAGTGSKVTVVSDFVLSNLENPSLIESRLKVLKSKGALVEIKKVAATGSNIGIVDAKLNTNNATVDLLIQNFNDAPEEFGLELNGDSFSIPNNLLEPKGRPGSFLSVSVPLANGISEFELTPEDDFMVDNFYYISIPDQEWVNVLVISNDNNARDSKLIPAVTAAGDQFTQVAVDFGVPPKFPDLEHNVYILKDVNTQFMLPGVVKGLRDEVEDGAVLVVLAQDDLFSIDLLDLLPVERKAQAEQQGGKVQINTNSSLSLMRALSDIGQADGSQLLRVSAKEEAITYAYASTNDGNEPVIAAKRIGKGAIIYYGIKDQKNFDIDPQSYAVIWGRIIDFSLTDPMSLNVPTGAVVTNNNGRVNTPMGRRDSPVLATRSGFYQVPQASLAANLYPLQAAIVSLSDSVALGVESNIAEQEPIQASEETIEEVEVEDVKVPKDLITHFLVAALIVLLLELLYVKYRGDL